MTNVIQRFNDGARCGAIVCHVSDLPDLFDNVSKENHACWTTSPALPVTGMASTYNQEFYGYLRSPEQAKALYTDGWAEGAAQALKLAEGLRPDVPTPADVRRRLHWSDQGDDLSIDRALAGNWDVAFSTRRRTVIQAPRTISIGCGFGGNMNISHEQLTWCGAQMVAITDLLETAGYRVELHAIRCNDISGGASWFVGDILVKESDEPLRPDLVAATFGHAGTFRTFGFAVTNQAPWTIGTSFRTEEPGKHMAECVRRGWLEQPTTIVPLAYDHATAVANIRNALTQIAASLDGER